MIHGLIQCLFKYAHNFGVKLIKWKYLQKLQNFLSVNKYTVMCHTPGSEYPLKKQTKFSFSETRNFKGNLIYLR